MVIFTSLLITGPLYTPAPRPGAGTARLSLGYVVIQQVEHIHVIAKHRCNGKVQYQYHLRREKAENDVIHKKRFRLVASGTKRTGHNRKGANWENKEMSSIVSATRTLLPSRVSRACNSFNGT